MKEEKEVVSIVQPTARMSNDSIKIDKIYKNL